MMKKIAAILILLLFTGIALQASVCITRRGDFKNSDIVFHVAYMWGNGTPMPDRPMHVFHNVSFRLTSRKGFDVYNRSRVVYQGRSYIFMSGNVKNHFFKSGWRRFNKNTIKDGSLIKLVYEIRRPGNVGYIRTRKVEKTFRIVFLKKRRGWSRWMKLVEVK